MEIIKRYPVLAAAASFWQPGLGQILCQRITRGIVFLTLFWAFIYIPQITYPLLSHFLDYIAIYDWRLILSALSPVITLILKLAVTIWATYDAYHIASQKTVQETSL